MVKSEIQKVMKQKNCSLPAQVWSLVSIIIQLFVLDNFIFEASREEYDVTKFSQLNGAAWTLPGEQSSLIRYKYRLTFINTSNSLFYKSKQHFKFLKSSYFCFPNLYVCEYLLRTFHPNHDCQRCHYDQSYWNNVLSLLIFHYFHKTTNELWIEN